MTETEYASVSTASRAAFYLKNLLCECQHSTSYVNMGDDNLSALTQGAHKSVYQKIKNIAIRYHYMKSPVNDEFVRLSLLKTKCNYADMLAKACDSTTFKHPIYLLLQ